MNLSSKEESESNSVVRHSALQWTPELVAKFWAFQTQTRPFSYFTIRNGEGIVEQASPFLHKDARILDYGCGPGHLTERLLNSFRVAGFDTTRESSEAARKRLGAHKNLIDLYSTDRPPPKETFDAVFLVEIAEHLPKELFASVARQIADSLKQGGRLFVTTPNDEDLDTSTTFCPCCEHSFHIWQHVRSFDAQSLRSELEELGFRVEKSFETNFAQRKTLQTLPRRIALRALRRKPPHLMCVATRV